MLYRLAGQLADLFNLSPAVHATIQSCCVVLSCLGIITFCLGWHADDASPVVMTALEWSFATLMSSSAFYHVTGVVHRMLNRHDK